jgi:cell division protein FtsW (lipid II flippase)
MTTKVIPGLLLICLLITGFQWFLIRKKTPLKERLTYLSILCLCWILALILVFNPGLPGPTNWLDSIFRPLGKLIDK